MKTLLIVLWIALVTWWLVIAFRKWGARRVRLGKRWSARKRSRIGGGAIAASGLLMIVATFIPWWDVESYCPNVCYSSPNGVSGWELFRKFGVTYHASSMPSGQGSDLWTGIVTLVIGIAAVILGAWLGTQFDEARERRPPYSRAVRLGGVLLGLTIVFAELVAWFQQVLTLDYEIVYTSHWPADLMFLAIFALALGLFAALKGGRVPSESAAVLSPS
jgi:hypothetical protein